MYVAKMFHAHPPEGFEPTWGVATKKKNTAKKKNSWGEPGDITQTIQWYTKP